MTQMARLTGAAPRTNDRSAVRVQMDVLYALMLHDIKSRFFGNGLGYIVTILWPVAHILIILSMFIFTGRPIPYGDSKLLYVVTGVYPYIIWNYISRFTMTGVNSNKSYLSYPVISLLDLILSRIILEINTSFIILIWILALLWIEDVQMFPRDIHSAILGLFAAVCLGIGFAVLGAVLTSIFPLFVLIYVGILIASWVTSGIYINPELLPDHIADMIAWNPLLHCVELIRSSYYLDYPHRLLSVRYVFEVSFVSLTLGLLLQRFCKRFT